MICLAYYSSATGPMDAGRLEQILATSRRNNQRDGLTGMLCHYDGSFLQFLEGEEGQVGSAFERICGDRRHRGVLEVFRQPIQARAFGEWTMALVRAEDIGDEQRAFCRRLRHVEIGADAAHRGALAPFLQTFRAWIR